VHQEEKHYGNPDPDPDEAVQRHLHPEGAEFLHGQRIIHGATESPILTMNEASRRPL
jgi:hypothetical protein